MIVPLLVKGVPVPVKISVAEFSVSDCEASIVNVVAAGAPLKLTVVFVVFTEITAVPISWPEVLSVQVWVVPALKVVVPVPLV